MGGFLVNSLCAIRTDCESELGQPDHLQSLSMIRMDSRWDLGFEYQADLQLVTRWESKQGIAYQHLDYFLTPETDCKRDLDGEHRSQLFWLPR